MTTRPRGAAHRVQTLVHDPALRMILGWIAIMALITLVGALGFTWIEDGWSFFDGLFMAVNVLATVGFSGDHPLDTLGKLWTMLLSFISVAFVFGTVGVMAEALLQRASSGNRKRRRMQKQIDQLTGHFIICGYGRVGSMVARELTAEGHDVVVIDIDQTSTARAAEDGILTVPGTATEDETLVNAGVQRARGLVTCVDSDPDNVYVVLTARSLNPDLFIVGRAGSKEVVRKLRQAGANRAVSPYVMGGRRMAQLAVRPGVVDFIDAAMSNTELDFSMEEIPVLEGSRLVGMTVGDLRARGIFTLAILMESSQYDHRPQDDRLIEPGEHLIVSGATETLRAIDEHV
ncbi:potassium channel family protein [Raineyella fluvialis]|uniref:Potassium channel protein n=1 Tax=Raineyella fluvialis TaxID=2662261 RepID=A0A5Q2FHQ1_9ACTN|nr:potassium channel protein [Raineyella fluvialis]QGF24683.1 potassium channel protein [Raineyella fluvialis]